MQIAIASGLHSVGIKGDSHTKEDDLQRRNSDDGKNIETLDGSVDSRLNSAQTQPCPSVDRVKVEKRGRNTNQSNHWAVR